MNINKITILIIIIFLFLTTIEAIIFLPVFSRPIDNDSVGYDTIAINLATDFTYTVFPGQNHVIAPGYPTFLAIIYKLLGHNYKLVYFIQFYLLAGIAIISYFFGKKYLRFTNWQAMLPGLIIIFWPYYILYASLLLTEIYYSFLLAIFVYYLFSYLSSGYNLKKAILMGILISIIGLTRPLFLLLPFWLIGFNLLFSLKKLKQKKISLKNINFKFYLIPLIIFVILIYSWNIFGYAKTGYFSPAVAANTGIIINSLIKRTDNIAPSSSYDNLPENERPNFKKTVITKLKNIYRFWNRGAGGTQAEELTSTHPFTKNIILIYKIFFFLIVFLAFGSLYFIKKNVNILILWIIIFYFWMLHSVLFIFPRYTLPIIQFIIILAFYFLYNINKYKNDTSIKK